MSNTYLKQALAEPNIAKRVNPGLSGATFIDNVIGAVEREIFHQGTRSELGALYDGLKLEYPAHFSNDKRVQSTKEKKHGYNARNGF